MSNLKKSAVTLVQLLRLLRAKQWTKNTFIFFPLIFSGRLFSEAYLLNTVFTFAGFCLVSSSMYILNDYLDLKHDRLHPKKSKRPLAQMNVNPGILTGIILMLQFAGLMVCKRVDVLTLYIAILYVLLNLAYNLYAKKIVLLDVIFIAFGFHLRIWAGSTAAEVMPSAWLQMCVFLLALFLGFTKRRYEISALKEKASEHRSVLAHYTSYLLDQIIIICSTLAIVFYGLYTISSDVTTRLGNQNMIYSVIFVIYGIFRYLYLVHVKMLGDEPGDALLKDIPLLLCVLLWISYITFVVYTTINTAL